MQPIETRISDFIGCFYKIITTRNTTSKIANNKNEFLIKNNSLFSTFRIKLQLYIVSLENINTVIIYFKKLIILKIFGLDF